MHRSIFITGLALAACATTSDDVRPSVDHAGTAQDVASTTAPDTCAALAAELGSLLAAAQRCHPAAANPTQCASWVPSIDGCSQPVAYAGSDEVKAYLVVFEKYAAACPLPDPPCVDPSTLAVDCTQAPGADAAAGRCTIVAP